MGFTTWSGQQIVDPYDLENRFAVEDGMAYFDSIFLEEMSEDAEKKILRIQGIMEHLPAREADFVDLYYFKKFKQTDIAHLFKVSQPTVCYRLQRATIRIKYLLELPHVEEEEMRVDLTPYLDDSLNVEIMILMYQVTCQSVVAKHLGVSQGLVRHRFIKSITQLRLEQGLEFYVKLFESISKNLNITREVKRSSWEGVTHVVE